MSDSDDSFTPPEDSEKEVKGKKKVSNKNASKEDAKPKEKASKRKNASKDDDNEDDNEDEKVAAKKTKGSNEPESITDKDGVKMYKLSKDRYVSKSSFKNQDYINIREYYNDKSSSELKPGKKGISLSMDQFNALKAAMEFL
uniref:PC4 domain-containing protein n=1 Tax=Rhabditophanes sp. KR3021 TaxID=114890 RepID=A0AC35TUY6_9BILA